MNWAETIRSYQAVDPAIPDSRIELFASLSCDRARAYLGTTAFTSLLDAQDARLIYSVAAFTIADLLKSSRMINEGSSIHDVNAFGSGEIRSSEISEILRLSRNWEDAAISTLTQLRSEIPSELGWVDI